jgi:hypothetical protein
MPYIANKAIETILLQKLLSLKLEVEHDTFITCN